MLVSGWGPSFGLARLVCGPNKSQIERWKLARSSNGLGRIRVAFYLCARFDVLVVAAR